QTQSASSTPHWMENEELIGWLGLASVDVTNRQQLPIGKGSQISRQCGHLFLQIGFTRWRCLVRVNLLSRVSTVVVVYRQINPLQYRYPHIGLLRLAV